MPAKVQVALTESQEKFIQLYDEVDNAAFIAGLGSGKSHTMGLRAVLDAFHSASAIIGIYEPTYELIKRVAVPMIQKWMAEFGIIGKYNKNDHEILTSSSKCGDFIFKNMSEPESMIGYETYRAHCDEIDTMPADKARDAYFAVMARNRQQLADVPQDYRRWSEENQRFECVNKIGVYTTPEGYKFCYQMWVEQDHPHFKKVHARTEENPTLSSSYKQSLLSKYPTHLVDAYLNGLFVNMTSGSVYHCYDKDKHNSTEQIIHGEPLYIGCDFNVGHMAATVFVKRNNGQEWHAVAELVDLLDTPNVIQVLTERWKSKGHEIIMYPDASGASRKSTDASGSDIALLHQAGFRVRAHNKNPDVKDRVLATNKAFEMMKVFVNREECPNVSKCLIQQTYDKNGKPDKNSGTDHQNDATTYPIEYEMGINNQIVNVPYHYSYKRFA